MATNQQDAGSSEKLQMDEFLRQALPACQPQEASPASTFTTAELQELRNAISSQMKIGPLSRQLVPPRSNKSNQVDIIRDSTFTAPQQQQQQQQGNAQDDALVQEESKEEQKQDEAAVSWHGAPKIATLLVTQDFRRTVRMGQFTGTTNGVCPGYLQCNLVVLPQGQFAFDFLLFCQRNKKACPLIEVCNVGSPHPHGIARGADLRTDVPKYAIYRNGKLEKEVTDATDYWPSDSVAFLIGCSFSYDGALLDAGIPLRSAEQGKNVPMYKTTLPCRPSGCLEGNMVVSMKPINAVDVAKEVEITSQYPHAHGGPVCVGNANAIGIDDLEQPEWGDAIALQAHEVPVFHACGVTPQSVLMDSGVPFAITHSAGHMFVTDLPANTSFH